MNARTGTPTILVVEDNPITRKMLRVALESEGYAVVEAADGRAALAEAFPHSPASWPWPTFAVNIVAAFLLGYFAWNTRRLIIEQITRTVDAEITGLSEQYNQGGIRRLVFVIDARARRPGSSLYLVTTFNGD